MLSSAVFQPIHTALSDIFGRKRILYVCIIFFVIGSAVVGWATTSFALIAGRTIQGIGGGGMEALCEVILTDMTTLKERPIYIGVLGLMWAGGSVLAPIAGGLFSEYLTWRWIAWINLPLMGIAMVLLPLFLTLKEDRSSALSKLKRVDWCGIFLFLIGMTSFTLALTWGGQLYHWKSWQTIVPFVVGSLILLVFAAFEKRVNEPIISPRLFATSTSCAAFFGSFIHGIIIWCLVYYLVLYFQGAMQAKPFQAAVDAFPLAFTLTPSAIICALLIETLRRYLWSTYLGWLLGTAGIGTMALLDYDSSSALYHGLQIAPGVGAGVLLSALAVSLQASMSVDDQGVAMGMLVFFRAVGSVVGVALGSAIFTNDFSSRLNRLSISGDPQLPTPSDAVFFVTRVGDLNLPPATLNQILQLYAAPIKYIWIAVACLSGLGLVSTVFMKEMTLEKEEMGRQAFQPQQMPEVVGSRGENDLPKRRRSINQ